MPATMEYTEKLVVTHCWCGIALAIPSNLHRVAHDEGKSVHCPLGHKFVFNDSFEEKYERAKSQLAAARAAQDQAEAGERAARMREGKQRKRADRLQARAHAGVCPHCNRTFQQLARHMKSKHPECTAA